MPFPTPAERDAIVQATEAADEAWGLFERAMQAALPTLLTLPGVEVSAACRCWQDWGEKRKLRNKLRAPFVQSRPS